MPATVTLDDLDVAELRYLCRRYGLPETWDRDDLAAGILAAWRARRRTAEAELVEAGLDA